MKIDTGEFIALLNRLRWTGINRDLLGRMIRLEGKGGRLTVQARGYSTSGQAIEATGSIEADGVLAPVVMPAARLKLIARLIESGVSEVTYDNDDARLVIEGGGARFTIRGPLAGDPWKLGGDGTRTYPFPALTGDKKVVWRAPALRAAARFAAVATSTDDCRPVLCCLMLDLANEGDPRFAGTDSYRLHVAPFEAITKPKPFESAMLPPEVADFLPDTPAPLTVALKQSEPVSLAWSDGDISWRCSLRDGDQYPNYRGLIPGDAPSSMAVDVTRFARFVNRAVRLNTGFRAALRSELGDDRLVVHIQNEDVSMTDMLEAQTFGKKVTVGLNPVFLHASLRAFGSGVVQMNVFDKQKPLTLTSGDKLALIMPMRVE